MTSSLRAAIIFHLVNARANAFYIPQDTEFPPASLSEFNISRPTLELNLRAPYNQTEISSQEVLASISGGVSSPRGWVARTSRDSVIVRTGSVIATIEWTQGAPIIECLRRMHPRYGSHSLLSRVMRPACFSDSGCSSHHVLSVNETSASYFVDGALSDVFGAPMNQSSAAQMLTLSVKHGSQLCDHGTTVAYLRVWAGTALSVDQARVLYAKRHRALPPWRQGTGRAAVLMFGETARWRQKLSKRAFERRLCGTVGVRHQTDAGESQRRILEAVLVKTLHLAVDMFISTNACPEHRDWSAWLRNMYSPWVKSVHLQKGPCKNKFSDGRCIFHEGMNQFFGHGRVIGERVEKVYDLVLLMRPDLMFTAQGESFFLNLAKRGLQRITWPFRCLEENWKNGCVVDTMLGIPGHFVEPFVSTCFGNNECYPDAFGERNTFDWNGQPTKDQLRFNGHDCYRCLMTAKDRWNSWNFEREHRMLNNTVFKDVNSLQCLTSPEFAEPRTCEARCAAYPWGLCRAWTARPQIPECCLFDRAANPTPSDPPALVPQPFRIPVHSVSTSISGILALPDSAILLGSAGGDFAIRNEHWHPSTRVSVGRNLYYEMHDGAK